MSADAVGPVFAALADPHRRAMIRALAEQRTVTATALAAELPISRQAVSKHLEALRRARLVDSTRRGRETHYRLDPKPLAEAASWIAAAGAEWDARLARLHRLLGSGAAAGTEPR